MTGFKPGDRVRHHTGVEGTVTRAQGNFATVEWDAYVRANTHHTDLLTPLGEPVASEKNFTGRNGIVLGILTMSAPAGHFGMDVDDVGVHISDGDAPAIALAILEAAGVKPIDHSNVGCTDGSPEALEEIAFWLTGHVTESAKAAKEKAERESLEADALKLYIGYAGGKAAPKTFAKMDAQMQWRFMAVARAARELHGVTP